MEGLTLRVLDLVTNKRRDSDLNDSVGVCQYLGSVDEESSFEPILKFVLPMYQAQEIHRVVSTLHDQ